MDEYISIIYFFAACSFIGWLHELIYHAVFFKKFHKPGFLTLPLLPVYGFGALAILAFADQYKDNPLQVFIYATIAATVVEYITAVTVEGLFKVRLWNYDKWPFNLQGRVSLLTSLFFGFGGVGFVYIIAPYISSALASIPQHLFVTGGEVLLIVICFDFIHSIITFARQRYQVDGLALVKRS